jgi:hypothetical protein
MAETVAIKVRLDSESDAAETRALLQGEPDAEGIETVKQDVPSGDRTVIPIFVWVVVAASIGVSSLVKVIIHILERWGCSVVVAQDDAGQIDLRKDCDVRGLLILQTKDGPVFVPRELIDFTEVVKAIAAAGVDKAADDLKEKGVGKDSADAAKSEV